jgi:hypothetical protein
MQKRFGSTDAWLTRVMQPRSMPLATKHVSSGFEQHAGAKAVRGVWPDP